MHIKKEKYKICRKLINMNQQQQQQQQQQQTFINPAMIDDWLSDELCQSGLIFSEDVLNIFSNQTLLPHSPPISPPESKQKSTSSISPTVPLFPEINVPTVNKLPRLAPRPSTQNLVPSIPVIPSTPFLGHKRRQTTPEDQDEVALKRQKNTDAARRSRLKKLLKMESLEKRVSELESDNNQLNTRIAVLESEKAGLASKDDALQGRIRVLEAQLSEAHRALTKL